MRLRCRFAQRASGPYGPDASCQAAVMTAVPGSLLCRGTVGDLARFMARRRPNGSGSDGAPEANGEEQWPELSLGGFLLPAAAPMVDLIREDDEIWVHSCGDLALLGMRQRLLALPAPRCATAAADDCEESEEREEEEEEYDDVVANAAAEAAALASEAAEALASSRGQRVRALENQVKELSAQLAHARKAVEPTLMAAASASSSSAAPGVVSQGPPCISAAAAAAAVAEVSWAPLVSLEALSEGDKIRYRLLLVDAWRGRQKRSSLREAIVTRLQHDAQSQGDGGRGLQVVLRQADGAMDCLEASRLLDVSVASRAGSR